MTTTQTKPHIEEEEVLPDGWELSDLTCELWEKYYSQEGKELPRAERIKLRLKYNRAAQKYNDSIGWKCFYLIP